MYLEARTGKSQADIHIYIDFYGETVYINIAVPSLFRFCRNLNLFAVDAKFLVEKALAFQELADHGLSGGQVAILTGKQGQNKPAT